MGKSGMNEIEEDTYFWFLFADIPTTERNADFAIS